MYVILNKSSFPIIIRDLNFHIAGGKSVALDLVISINTSEVSEDLKKLIDSKKIEIINKDNYRKEENKPKKSSEDKKVRTSLDDGFLLDLKKDLIEIKNFIKEKKDSGKNVESEESSDPEVQKKLADLRVRNISKQEFVIKTNFDKLGESTVKKDEISNLVDVLDSLSKEDNKGE